MRDCSINNVSDIPGAYFNAILNWFGGYTEDQTRESTYVCVYKQLHVIVLLSILLMAYVIKRDFIDGSKSSKKSLGKQVRKR